MIDKKELCQSFFELKKQAPLVHNITNYVAMNFSANVLLAMGASPVMAHAVGEMDDMVAIANALAINIGTFDALWGNSMLLAGKTASRMGKPIVLDPVGAGATKARTELSWKLINDCKPSVIRGNASEIAALCDSGITAKGVDSTIESASALDYAIKLANHSGAVVVISGATDYITDGQRVETIINGSPMMASVTAMGCSSTSVIAAFTAVAKPFEAALYGMALMGVAGERAAKVSNGPGSMSVNFLDELYNITPEMLAQEVRQK
ncbi:MAG: hydroxyethylthiazole kinase [Bacteroidales bacterium]|nr:hydroxyethylthiazole kinase [Bacteroidales bacterium]